MKVQDGKVKEYRRPVCIEQPGIMKKGINGCGQKRATEADHECIFLLSYLGKCNTGNLDYFQNERLFKDNVFHDQDTLITSSSHLAEVWSEELVWLICLAFMVILAFIIGSFRSFSIASASL